MSENESASGGTAPVGGSDTNAIAAGPSDSNAASNKAPVPIGMGSLQKETNRSLCGEIVAYMCLKEDKLLKSPPEKTNEVWGPVVNDFFTKPGVSTNLFEFILVLLLYSIINSVFELFSYIRLHWDIANFGQQGKQA